jgi:hypothetical protein
MCHLMQDATRLIIVIISTSSSILGEVPVSVVGARYDSIVTRDRVEQCATVGAVTVDVGTVDRGGSGLYSLHICVD